MEVARETPLRLNFHGRSLNFHGSHLACSHGSQIQPTSSMEVNIKLHTYMFVKNAVGDRPQVVE